MLLRTVAERLGVGFKRAHPQVERAVRLHILVAHLVQSLGQDSTVGGIRLHVGWLVDARRGNALEQHRRADIAMRAACAGNGEEHAVGLFGIHGVGNVHVAHALARQAERFGVRVAHQRAGIDGGNVGHFHAVGDLAIRLVADQVDRVADLLALLLEHGGQRLQVLARVHRAHRVVRRVDDDGSGLRVDGGRHCLHVKLEAGDLRGNLDDRAAHGLDPHLVLREVGAGDDDLVAGVGDGAQADGDGCGGAHRHVHAARLRRNAIATSDAVGDGLTNGGDAGSGRIRVQLDRRQLHKLLDGVGHLLRRRHAGVADGVIEHLVVADLGLALQTVGEQLADCGGRISQAIHSFVDHKVLLACRCA